jgi:N-acetylneuraminic acid mutarotase
MIYVAGGIAYPIARPGALEAYDTTTGSWSLKTPMPEDVNHAAAASYRGSMYVLGGYTGFPENGPLHGLAVDETGRFFRYRPLTDTWTELTPMPTSRGALGAAVIGHRLYAVGGFSAALGTLARLEIYDFRTGRWSRGPDMRTPREHLAAAALEGDLYVFGGRDYYGGHTYATAERFVPALGRWEQSPSMRIARAGFQAVAAGDRIVVFGGERPGSGPRGTIGQVESFEPHTRAWTELPPMPHPRHGLAGAWDGRRVYALEGGEETVLGGSTLAEALTVTAAPVRPVRHALRLTLRPRRVPAGRASRVRILVTARLAGRRRAVAGAIVRFLGRAMRTDRRGSVRLRVLLQRRGSYRVRATRRGFRAATGTIRAVRRTRHRSAPQFTG